MSGLKKLALGVATGVLAATLAVTAAQAQETTSGIDGVARSTSGAPLAGAQVTVTYEPTNQTFTTRTNAQGLFSVRQLPPGGPYRVTVNGGEAPVSQEVANIGLGSPYQVELGGAPPRTATEVVVTAARLRGQTLQTGPRSTFTAADVATLPSFSRDIKDIIRLNPFVTIDPTNNNALIISGNNNRFNTTYVDGVKLSDDFGLNANGYPTQRSPISVDLIQSTNVEIAPYDVRYGSFQGGIVNIATKSGGNEFHGNAFYEYDSNELGSGHFTETPYARPCTAGVPARCSVSLSYKDKAYGFTLGGPILKDRLFFEFGYEKYEGLPVGGYGPSDGVGLANPVPGVTQADITQITSILKSVYNYDPGAYGAALPVEDEKIFGKLTWLINDKHRFVFEVMDDTGSTFNNPGSTTTGRTLGLLSNTYNFVQPLEAYTGFLYSNWTPNLSTELSYTYRTVGGITQNGGAPFARFRINLASGAAVFVGPDISRQANALDYSDQLFRARVNYTLGSHALSAGYEREDLSVFNLFVQNATGDYTFSSIANLQARTAASLNYASAASNNYNDGAANWGDVLDTFYVQDQWRILPNLTLTAGVRAELYEQGDKPQNNPFFQSLYGFSNQATLDGLYTIMPRFGFNWRPEPTLVVSGGFGLFSGGAPNVWVSNNYSNTGNLLGAVNCTTASSTPGNALFIPNCLGSLTNVTGSSIPAGVQAQNTVSANGGTGITNALDPKFKLPAVYKASIGVQKTFNFSEMGWTGWLGRYLGDNWRLHGDYLYQWTDEAVTWRDLLLTTAQTVAAPDGRPIYSPARFTARKLNNSYDLLLTNTSKGYAEVWTVGAGKSWQSGLDVDFNYTHTNVKDVNPGTSSVALSNYSQVAFSDPNNPTLSTSNYEIKNQLKFSAGFQHNFFGDYRTSIRLYAQRRSGLPFSYTFQSTATSGTSFDPVFGISGAVAQRNQQLLYVPMAAGGTITATSDPRVTYAQGFDVAAFDAFIKQTGLSKYYGQITPRNAFTSRDVTTADIAFTQEIPAPIPYILPKARGELFFDLFNVGNMINPSWGVLDQIGFPYVYPAVTTALACNGAATPVTATGVPACGGTRQYLYQSFGTRVPTVNTGGSPPASVWAMKVGIRFKF